MSKQEILAEIARLLKEANRKIRADAEPDENNYRSNLEYTKALQEHNQDGWEPIHTTTLVRKDGGWTDCFVGKEPEAVVLWSGQDGWDEEYGLLRLDDPDWKQKLDQVISEHEDFYDAFQDDE